MIDERFDLQGPWNNLLFGELQENDFAQVLTIPPNVAHTDEFAAIARQAREASQGLWGACQLLADGKVAPASSPGKGGGG